MAELTLRPVSIQEGAGSPDHVALYLPSGQLIAFFHESEVRELVRLGKARMARRGRSRRAYLRRVDPAELMAWDLKNRLVQSRKTVRKLLFRNEAGELNGRWCYEHKLRGSQIDQVMEILAEERSRPG